ncbi:DUF2860 domain-containing protein [Desulfobotulus sp. H1]|uniref:DUF2860 domain-containing protein n=1 Tax=Desulfobotulus pelophilus TaxID=2823377 RepID=A0ABT3N7H6_9BACT|nr:DUF2860 family protein [Desulfobotulus pelophilus]MCW7753410.1 DUF2860 domain-containing protein [Desulfobotulus pelophilus]
MKKTIFTLVTALLFIAHSVFSKESEMPFSQTGFSGQIFIGAGGVTGKSSGLETDPGKVRISGWNQGQKQFTSSFIIAEASLNYAFPTGTTLVAESGTKSGALPAVGISQKAGALGTLGILASMGSWDVWKNPYLLNQDRSKTRQREKSLTLFLENFLETGITMHYTGSWTDVKEDGIAAMHSDLTRRGHTHQIRLGCGLPLRDTLILTPEISYERGLYSGKSNAYQAFGSDLSLTRVMEGWMMTVSLNGIFRNFEKSHPVLGKTREEKEGSAALTLIIPAPMGYEQLTLMVMAGHSRVHASHAFFESRASFAGAGMGYAF